MNSNMPNQSHKAKNSLAHNFITVKENLSTLPKNKVNEILISPKLLAFLKEYMSLNRSTSSEAFRHTSTVIITLSLFLDEAQLLTFLERSDIRNDLLQSYIKQKRGYISTGDDPTISLFKKAIETSNHVSYEKDINSARTVVKMIINKTINLYFHGANAASLTSISLHGLSSEHRDYQREEMEGIQKIFKKYGINFGLGCFESSERKIFLSGINPTDIGYYAEEGPEWFRYFTGMATSYTDARKWVENRCKTIESISPSIKQAILGKHKFQREKRLDQEKIIDFFEAHWARYRLDKKGIVVLANETIPAFNESIREMIIEASGTNIEGSTASIEDIIDKIEDKHVLEKILVGYLDAKHSQTDLISNNTTITPDNIQIYYWPLQGYFFS